MQINLEFLMIVKMNRSILVIIFIRYIHVLDDYWSHNNANGA